MESLFHSSGALLLGTGGARAAASVAFLTNVALAFLVFARQQFAHEIATKQHAVNRRITVTVLVRLAHNRVRVRELRIENVHLGRAVGGNAPDKTETFSMPVSPITK
jgi:shikimate 5-dehydrogenase